MTPSRAPRATWSARSAAYSVSASSTRAPGLSVRSRASGENAPSRAGEEVADDLSRLIGVRAALRIAEAAWQLIFNESDNGVDCEGDNHDR